MAFIEIINDEGSVLIDDEYCNLVYLYAGAVTVGSSAGGGWCQISVSAAAGFSPVIGLSCSFLATISRATFDGTSYTYWIACEQGAIGATLQFHVFVIPPAIPDLNGYVQLRNAQNQVTFDSNLRYFRLLYFKPPSESWSNVNVPAGKTCCFVPLQPGFRSLSRNENPTPPPWRYVVTDDYFGYRLVSGQLQGARFISQIQTRTSNQALPEWAQSYASPASGVMLVDITGY